MRCNAHGNPAMSILGVEVVDVVLGGWHGVQPAWSGTCGFFHTTFIHGLIGHQGLVQGLVHVDTENALRRCDCLGEHRAGVCDHWSPTCNMHDTCSSLMGAAAVMWLAN